MDAVDLRVKLATVIRDGYYAIDESSETIQMVKAVETMQHKMTDLLLQYEKELKEKLNDQD